MEMALSKKSMVSRKVALRESARKLEEELVPSSSTLDRELHSYERTWNKLIGKTTHNNLTEDVNSLIRDYLRKVLRHIKSEGFNRERIENLADTLVKTPALQKIGEPDAMLMYIQLYFTRSYKHALSSSFLVRMLFIPRWTYLSRFSTASVSRRTGQSLLMPSSKAISSALRIYPCP